MSETGTQATSTALLAQAVGSYVGPNLLWFTDPEKPLESAAEVEAEADRVRYTWSYQGEPQSGVMTYSFATDRIDLEWTDTWHSPGPMRFSGDHVADALIVSGSYSAGDGPDWGWRIELRVTGPRKLLVEMFNIHPDGEEAIAVRLDAERR